MEVFPEPSSTETISNNICSPTSRTYTAFFFSASDVVVVYCFSDDVCTTKISSFFGDKMLYAALCFFMKGYNVWIDEWLNY